MTDFATYKALPAAERDELGFAKWKDRQQITTHGPGCHAWGRHHYSCAMQEIEALQSRVQEVGQMARDNRSRKVVELEGEIARLKAERALQTTAVEGA